MQVNARKKHIIRGKGSSTELRRPSILRNKQAEPKCTKEEVKLRKIETMDAAHNVQGMQKVIKKETKNETNKDRFLPHAAVSNLPSNACIPHTIQ